MATEQMTEQELIELSKVATGDRPREVTWNPLQNLEEARELAKELKMVVVPRRDWLSRPAILAECGDLWNAEREYGSWVQPLVEVDGDKVRAECKAITHTAAQVGLWLRQKEERNANTPHQTV